MPLPISTTSQAGEAVSPFAAGQMDQVQKERDVSDELAKLSAYLSAKNKGGILAIRTTSSGGKEMYRMQWYHRLWFCRTGVEQQKAAVNYASDLLSLVQKESEKASNSFAAYLSPAGTTDQNVGTELRPSTGQSTSTSIARPLSEESNSLDGYLQSQGITKGEQIGEGAQGSIYSITYSGNENDYLYKEESSPHLITDPEDSLSGHKFYRISGDISAGRCKLPNTVESVGFFLKIIKNPKAMEETAANPDVEYHYLPNTTPEEIKKNAQKLIEANKGAEIYLYGQIMKRAPGKNLGSLISQGEIDTDPQQAPFKNIVYGLYSFLAAARPKNFVHRDIKPSNLIFDQKTGRVIVIDMTSGRHLARRGKALARESESNRSTIAGSIRDSMMTLGRESVFFRPTTVSKLNATQDQNQRSSLRFGEVKPSNRSTIGGMEGTTLAFAHPAALAEMKKTPTGPQEEQYGAEFDCFSKAMTLLALINKEDFIKYQSSKFPSGKHEVACAAQLAKDWGTNPKKYFKNYLSWIGGNNSETAKILEQNPELRNYLQLLFEASAAGAEGEAAFAKLAINPYLLSCAVASLQAPAAT